MDGIHWTLIIMIIIALVVGKKWGNSIPLLSSV
jgi:hypothetical protein